MRALNPTLPGTELAPARDHLARARAGDAEAFCELCREYETPLLRQATLLCGQADLAEDLAQETLVEAWRCLRRFNGQCRFFTWLCAILLNRFRTFQRKKRAIPFSALPAEVSERMAVESPVDARDDASHPESAMALKERSAVVLNCLQRLSPAHREVIQLRFYVDDSLEGIAVALGCSVGTVKSRLFHALEQLRGMQILTKEVDIL